MPKSVPATRIVAPVYCGWLSTKAGSSRQAANSPSPNPIRLTRLRYSAGMIWSVSTLVRRSGSARPVWVTNGSIEAVSFSQVGGRGEVAGHGGGGGDRGRDQMGAPALALAALEVAVGGGGAALAGGELVRVHAQAHRAAGRAPLGAGRGEHRVQALLLGLGPDLHGPGYDQHPDGRGDPAPAQDGRGGAQVFEPAVGARAEEHGVHGHVAQC